MLLRRQPDKDRLNFFAPKAFNYEELYDIYLVEKRPITASTRMGEHLKSDDSFAIYLDNLLRLRLLESQAPYLDRDKFLKGETVRENLDYRVTSLGEAFVSVCRRCGSHSAGK